MNRLPGPAESRRSWSLRGAAPPPAWIAVYLLLLALVWGLFAADRGLFQDDVVVLAAMTTVTTPGAVFTPITTPTRRLQGVWSYLALESGNPVMFLQLLYGLSWLATGLVARQIAGELAPGRRLEPYLAGALTLCATSDFLTNSLVAVGYQIAILAIVAAAGCGLAWCRGRGVGFLLASVALLTISMWTLDVGLSAIPLLPALFWLAPPGTEGPRRMRRLGVLVACWAAALVPYGYVLGSAMRDPQSYYATAAASLSLPARLLQSAQLWLANFTPWTWVVGRPVWFSTEPLSPPLPGWLMLAMALFGTAVFGWGLRAEWLLLRPRLDGHERAARLRSAGALVVLLGLAFSANAIFAGVLLSQIHYRTHLLSRVWTSIFLALAVGMVAARRRWVLLVPVFFVAWGIAGGLERQGFFTAFWREHQRELASLVRAVPAMQPGTEVVLHVPLHPRYLATEAHYAQAWLSMLYEDPTLWRSALRWSPIADCRPEPLALVCAQEGYPGAPDRHVPYERLLLLGLDPATATYSVLTQLPTMPAVTPAAYRPEARIVRRSLSTMQQRLLLLDHRFLVRWLPDARRAVAAQSNPGPQPVSALPSQSPTPQPTPFVPPRVSEPLPSSAFSVAWASSSVPQELRRGETISVAVTVTNTGRVTWPDLAHSKPPGHAVRLSHRWLVAGDSSPTPGAYNGRVDLPAPVAPGGTVKLVVAVTAPAEPGSYVLQLDLVEEFVTWFESRGAATLRVPVRVP